MYFWCWGISAIVSLMWRFRGCHLSSFATTTFLMKLSAAHVESLEGGWCPHCIVTCLPFPNSMLVEIASDPSSSSSCFFSELSSFLPVPFYELFTSVNTVRPHHWVTRGQYNYLLPGYEDMERDAHWDQPITSSTRGNDRIGHWQW